MTEASCHCGEVRLTFPEPVEVTDCNCSVCRRYGALWAYDSPARVTVASARPTDTYVRAGGDLAFHRCATCGCVVTWRALEGGRDRMGYNARLMPPEILARCRVRHLDGADTWSSWIEEPKTTPQAP